MVLISTLKKKEEKMNRAKHASPTARNFFPILISTFPDHSHSLLRNSLPVLELCYS